MKKSKVLFASVGFFVLTAGIPGSLFYYGEWRQVVSILILAICLGTMTAPQFEPKAFRNPGRYQVIAGAIGGASAAYVLSENLEVVALGFLVGVVLGFLAPYWVDRVTLP